MMTNSIFALITAVTFTVVGSNPDHDRAARSVVDENGVILYHENIESGLNGYWVEAKDLREGDVFLGANGELSTLVATERVVFPDGIKVYNFTVDGNYDYFVIASVDEYGQTCVLVHNAYCIQQGVHRSAAARNIGMEKIRANVNSPDGKILAEGKEIAIRELYSPRDVLIPDKYARTLEKMIISPETMPPIEVMKVSAPPKYVPSIMDVH